MLLYITILALVIVSVLLFGLLFLYSFYLGKFTERDSELHKKSENIIESAHSKAKFILSSALERSKSIISETEAVKSGVEQELESGLRATVSKSAKVFEDDALELSKSYKNMHEEIKQTFLSQVKETLSKVQEAGELGLQEFKASLKDQQLTSQYYIEKRLNQEFENAQKEVARYKQEQMRLVEDSIDKIILKLSEEILGKAISLEEHEKLIFEALGRARDEGVFGK